jgi:hypothetical protein
MKTTFFNGELDEKIYMDRPDGFVVKGEERKVCKLLKSLYSLEQPPIKGSRCPRGGELGFSKN